MIKWLKTGDKEEHIFKTVKKGMLSTEEQR